MGVAPQNSTAWAVAVWVCAGTMTSSPGFKPERVVGEVHARRAGRDADGVRRAGEGGEVGLEGLGAGAMHEDAATQHLLHGTKLGLADDRAPEGDVSRGSRVHLSNFSW